MIVKSSPFARWAGLLVGVALAFGLVLAGRMPASGAPAPARLSIAAEPTTALGVSPAGRDFLVARRLVPGGPAARGVLAVSNYTTAPLRAGLRLSSSRSELDRLVRLRLYSGGKTVYRGTLGALRSWAELRLGAGHVRRIEFHAFLPPSVASGFEGRSADLKLEWRTR